MAFRSLVVMSLLVSSAAIGASTAPSAVEAASPAVSLSKGGAGHRPSGLTPARLADTRHGEQTIDGGDAGRGPLAAGSTLVLDVTARGGVPADATTAVLNVAAVAPLADGFLTIYPCGHPFPLASAMTYAAGDVRAVAVPSKVGPDGTVCIFTLATTHLVVDVGGFVADG